MDAWADAAGVVLAGGRSSRMGAPKAALEWHGSTLPYRTAALAAGKRRPGMLFERCRVAELDDAALLADPGIALLDPGLESVTNVNEAADYTAARARPPEPVTVDVPSGRRTVRVASLGSAAAVVGVALAAETTVTLNGHLIQPDPHLPLVAGDTLAFR